MTLEKIGEVGSMTQSVVATDVQELKPKQDNLFYEWNKETDKLDILWILEDEGKHYQKVKSINVRKIMPEEKWDEARELEILNEDMNVHTV